MRDGAAFFSCVCLAMVLAAVMLGACETVRLGGLDGRTTEIITVDLETINAGIAALTSRWAAYRGALAEARRDADAEAEAQFLRRMEVLEGLIARLRGLKPEAAKSLAPADPVEEAAIDAAFERWEAAQ